FVWAGGTFRHSIMNVFIFSWKHPYFFLYSVVVLYVLAPVRWYEMVYHSDILPLVYGVHSIYLVVVFKKSWRPTLLLSPLYVLVNATLLLPIGMISYFKMVRNQKNWGIIRPVRGNASTQEEQAPLMRLQEQELSFSEGQGSL